MLKPFLIVSVLSLLGVPALLQEQAPPAQATPPAAAPTQAAPTPPAGVQNLAGVPAEYVSKVNPVRPTAESQARAKKQYGWDCAMCHGDNGDGKGDVATEQKLTIRDYRDPSSLKGLSDGAMFYVIQHGMGQMPSEGDRAKPDEIWNLVIYLRKMANSQFAPAAPAPSA